MPRIGAVPPNRSKAVRTPLFTDDSAPSAAYRNIRAAESEHSREAREHCEQLWELFEPYADREFRTEFRTNFHARYWEMHLTTHLIGEGFEVLCPKPGPDVGIEVDGVRIWFDATCPGQGAIGSADRVPDTQFGVAQYTPNEAMVLRYVGAIAEKHRQHENWLKQGVVAKDDAFIVAINPRNLGHEFGDSNPPRILQAAFPIGPLCVSIDRDTLEVAGSGYLYRDTLKKASGAEVTTGVFVTDGYETISGLLCSRVDAGNRPAKAGADFQLVPNPRAISPLPANFRLSGTYFHIDESDEGVLVTPDPPLS